MKRHVSWLLLAMGSSLACNGTSTGNPMGSASGGGSGGGVTTPDGAEFLSSDAPRELDPVVSDDDVAALASGNRAFAFDLYRELSGSGSGNLFVSPFSVSVALAMTHPGARGETAAQIADTFHFALPETALHPAFNATLSELAERKNQLAEEASGSGFELSIVNQAWGQQGYPFLDSYLDVLARNYGAGLFARGFRRQRADARAHQRLGR